MSAEKKAQVHSKNYGWYAFLLAVAAILVAGYFISTLKLYKSGDDIGRNMGWVGLSMMLTLSLYPLRKRFRFMKKLGALPIWFKWHMIFGILGPSLILYHSNFHVGSVNAGVALACMLLVSGSGIFGRFFYTKIHHGLYGRQATLQEIQAEKEQARDIKSLAEFSPEIQQKLDRFSDNITSPSKIIRIGIWDFLTVGIKAKWLYWSLVRKLKRSMRLKAREGGHGDTRAHHLHALLDEYKNLIRAYLKAVRDVAQFRTYERLFSLWHIFHLPLVFILILSAIFHIVGVYMF